MKIGYYCESPVDRAALAVFKEGILGEKPEPISMDLEARGVTGVFRALVGVFVGVHYASDAEGLVVVVDSDDTEVHAAAHDKLEGGEQRCRFCQIRKIIEQAKRRLKPRQGQPELKVAIGLAVPAIEAWYLVGNKNHPVGEAAFATAGQPPLNRKHLKKVVYGTERPSLELATQCAASAARRININAIETAFPVGFGLMAKEMRSWKAR